MVEHIPLGRLRYNDYNARKELSDIDGLAEDIDESGLDNSITVRPIDDDIYEVVAGERRFAAHKQLYDDDYEVECTVRDLSDKEARTYSLRENLNREELTPMEQATGYADLITVEVNEKEVTYKEYVNDKSLTLDADSLHVPTQNHSSVKELAEQFEPSPQTIHERLSFLLLPEEAQEWIDSNRTESGVHGLPIRAARTIVNKVRSGIDDPEAALEMMADLAYTYGDPDGEYSSGMTKMGARDDYAELELDIDGRVEEYNRRKEIVEEDTEEYAELLIDRSHALTDALWTMNDEFDIVDEEIPQLDDADDPEEIPTDSLLDVCETITETLRNREQELFDRAEDLTNQETTVENRRKRVAKALSAHDENRGICEFCHSEVTQDALEATRNELGEQKENLYEESEAASDRAVEIRDQRNDLQDKRRNVEAARESYQEAIETAEEFVAETAVETDGGE